MFLVWKRKCGLILNLSTILVSLYTTSTQSEAILQYEVDECPSTAWEWRKATLRLNCNLHGNENRYHCMPNLRRTTFLEFCDLNFLLSAGECPLVYQRNTSLVGTHKCENFVDDICPPRPYQSAKSFFFPGCRRINKEDGCFLIDPSCPSICCSGHEFDNGTMRCKQINQNETMQCLNGGSCERNKGQDTCKCLEGWTGNNCELDVNECDHNPCQFRCVNTPGHFQCRLCTEGWYGWHCKEDIDECQTQPCNNGGRCNNEMGTYSCTCESGWTGQNCDVGLEDDIIPNSTSLQDVTTLINAADELTTMMSYVTTTETSKSIGIFTVKNFMIFGVCLVIINLLLVALGRKMCQKLAKYKSNRAAIPNSSSENVSEENYHEIYDSSVYTDNYSRLRNENVNQRFIKTIFEQENVETYVREEEYLIREDSIYLDVVHNLCSNEDTSETEQKIDSLGYILPKKAMTHEYIDFEDHECANTETKRTGGDITENGYQLDSAGYLTVTNTLQEDYEMSEDREYFDTVTNICPNVHTPSSSRSLENEQRFDSSGYLFPENATQHENVELEESLLSSTANKIPCTSGQNESNQKIDSDGYHLPMLCEAESDDNCT